ncbi:MAG: ankyrin repeat domain-containing protein [Ottowia sp.]|nr:ankyrin repeat domain-containing protein [Ottowia sp.]
MKKLLLPALVLSALLSACATNGAAQNPAFSSCNTTKHKSDPSPLPYSARTGDTANVRCLLDAGADVNAADGNGWTPLMFAARDGHADIVRLLIERGANINAAQTGGKTAGSTALMWAAFSGHTDIARLLIDKGAHINATDKKGSTALMLAAAMCRADTARLLVEKGTNINVVATATPVTALDLAEAAGCPEEIAKMLHAAGAKRVRK